MFLTLSFALLVSGAISLSYQKISNTNSDLSVSASMTKVNISITAAHGMPSEDNALGCKMNITVGTGRDSGNMWWTRDHEIASSTAIPYAYGYDSDVHLAYYHRWVYLNSASEYKTFGKSYLAPGFYKYENNFYDMNVQSKFYVKSGIIGDKDVTFPPFEVFYNVHFSLNLMGGTTGNADIDAQFDNGSYYVLSTRDNTATNITSVMPKREGYTFKGFYDAEVGGNLYINSAGTFVGPAECRELFAQWDINTYSLEANANGGTIPLEEGWTGSGEVASKVLNFQQTVGTLPIPTRPGYTFIGWFTQPTGGTYFSSDNTMPASNTVIYAQWTINYILTANANGGTIPETIGWNGSGTSAVKELMDGSIYGNLPVASKDKYLFEGWYTAVEGGSKVTSSTRIDANTTIYARWLDTWVNHEAPSLEVDQSGAYLISTPQELARIANQINNTDRPDTKNLSVKLTSNIDLSAYYWTPIGTTSRPFIGTFDGCGYHITGLKTLIGGIDPLDSRNIGLFGCVQGESEQNRAVIKNVIIYGADVEGGYNTGILIGRAQNTDVSKCLVRGKVKGIGVGGGLIGKCAGGVLVSDCFNYAEVEGDGNIGGMIGSASSTEILNCTNVGNVHAANGPAGGIVAVIEGSTISHCQNLGHVSGGLNAGGIVGISNGGTIESCLSFANISSTSQNSAQGGILGVAAEGVNGTTISHSLAYGDLSDAEGLSCSGIIGNVLNTASKINYSCALLNSQGELLSGFFNSTNGSEAIVENSYVVIQSPTTTLKTLSSAHTDMDGNFTYIGVILRGMPVPVGLFAIADFGTQEDIVTYLATLGVA